MITTVTTHQSQLHGRILLTEVTQYIINLTAQHIRAEQYVVLIIHTTRYTMTNKYIRQQIQQAYHNIKHLTE